jgi:sarcosine oxidase gamma subunit
LIRRISPLTVTLKPDRVTQWNGWEIALTYVGESVHRPMFMTDISHVPQWALQGHNLDALRPAGLRVPKKPQQVTMRHGILITRLTPWECRIMALGNEIPEFTDAGYTDVTDAYASFAIAGPQCLEVLNKLCPVDVDEPEQVLPRSALAPVEDITCLIIRLPGKDDIPALIISGARGYGHFLMEIFLDAGKEYGLGLAGFQRFKDWLSGGG